MVKLIVARASNNVIGKNNAIPWKLPEDMAYFKSMTKDNVVIMGRRTYESIGKPLPNRINIVVSSTMTSTDVIVKPSLTDAIETAKSYQSQDIFLIGGKKIYEEGIKIADELLITEIEKPFDGDTTFVDFDKNDYAKVILSDHSNDEALPYRFVVYKRIRNFD